MELKNFVDNIAKGQRLHTGLIVGAAGPHSLKKVAGGAAAIGAGGYMLGKRKKKKSY